MTASYGMAYGSGLGGVYCYRVPGCGIPLVRRVRSLRVWCVFSWDERKRKTRYYIITKELVKRYYS